MLLLLGSILPSEPLQDFLQKKHFTKKEIVAAGIGIINKNGRLFDRFRHRLIFPLKNHRGQVVGFSGRIMSEKKDEAKYLNTPETLIYHKGKIFVKHSEVNVGTTFRIILPLN